MIKLSELSGNQGRIVRETTCPFVVNGRTETITVRYFSLSVRESKEYRSKVHEIEAAGGLYLSDVLAPVIESLPDIVDAKDKPIKITVEVLEGFNTINLRAIQTAIEEDVLGKSQPKK